MLFRCYPTCPGFPNLHRTTSVILGPYSPSKDWKKLTKQLHYHARHIQESSTTLPLHYASVCPRTGLAVKGLDCLRLLWPRISCHSILLCNNPSKSNCFCVVWRRSHNHIGTPTLWLLIAHWTEHKTCQIRYF